MKKPLNLVIPLLVIALAAAAAGGFFLWQALSYETAAANDSVSGALTHYQKASDQANTAIDIFRLGDFTATFNTDSDFQQIAAFVSKVNQQTTAGIGEARNELASYRAGLDQAAALKLKDSYRPYLNQRREAADALEASLNSLANLTPLIEGLYQGFSAFDKVEEMLKTDLSEDPAAGSAQIRAVRDEMKKGADQVHALAAQNKMPAVIDEMNQYLLTGFDKMLAMTDALVAGDYDRTMTLSKEVESHFSDQLEKEWQQRLQSGVSQWWLATVESQLANATQARNQAEAAQAAAQQYYDEQLK